MIFALKAYIGERSLRDQFKARHAINDCKAVSQLTPGWVKSGDGFNGGVFVF